MSKATAMRIGGHNKCSVIDCKGQSVFTHKLPTQEETRAKWLNFIFNGDVPVSTKKTLHVCQNHFTLDSYENLAQVLAGFATSRILKRGAVPTLRQLTATTSQASMPQATTSQATPAWVSEAMPTLSSVLIPRIPRKEDLGCQTDKPVRRTKETQLTLRRQKFRSIAIQTNAGWNPHPPKTVECGMNTDHSSISFDPGSRSTPSKRTPLKRRRLHVVEEENEEDDEDTIGHSSSLQESVSEYCPDESLQQLLPDSQESVLDTQPIPAHKEKKYIVFESKLMELFRNCSVCQGALVVVVRNKGTLIKVSYDCNYCESQNSWESQPSIRSTPVGNVELSAAVYLSGASFVKMEQIARSMNLQIHSYNTFLRHAKGMIEPAIIHTWKTKQNEMLQEQRPARGIILGGDMRADSPGHCAKYGSYTMMDLDQNKIIDLQLVQSNEAKDNRSNNMELKGLERSIKFLGDHGVKVNCIVTDRHRGVGKWLREEAKINQFYDVWHVEKGLSKKLVALSAKKEFAKLRPWIRSIRSHMYWTAATSTTPEERAAKWRAIANHVCNKHTHKGQPLFPKCLHPPRLTRDKNKWLKAGSPLVYKLDKLLYGTLFLKDVMKLSPHHQTSSLESFHAVVIRFSPKSVAFKYIGMLSRLYLAGLHYNENAGRPVRTGRDGEPLYKLTFPKVKKGEAIATAVKVDATFGYVSDLMDCIFEKVMLQPAPNPYVEALREINVPPPLCAQYFHPNRLDVISACINRFNQGLALRAVEDEEVVVRAVEDEEVVEEEDEEEET